MSEDAPNQESLSREWLVEILKNGGESLRVLGQYVEQKEKGFREARDNLLLNVEVAEILRDAGMLDEAYDAFLDARDQALSEGDEELAARLLGEAEKLVLR